MRLVKTPAPAAIAVTNDQLVAMLRTIGQHEAAAALDNRSLERSLGWTPAQTADSLAAAKARLLIWGIRVGGTPAPASRTSSSPSRVAGSSSQPTAEGPGRPRSHPRPEDHRRVAMGTRGRLGTRWVETSQSPP